MDGRSYRVEGSVGERGAVSMRVNGVGLGATAKDGRALLLEQFGAGEASRQDEREVRAPMPGLVVKVLVEPGEVVQKGQGLVILEAMKMENELRAPAAGTVHRVHIQSGQAVQKNQALIELGSE